MFAIDELGYPASYSSRVHFSVWTNALEPNFIWFDFFDEPKDENMSVPTCLCWFIRYLSLSRPSSTRIIYCLLNVWWLYIKTMCTNQMLLNINWVPEE